MSFVLYPLLPQDFVHMSVLQSVVVIKRVAIYIQF